MLTSKNDLITIKDKKVFFFDLDGTIYLGNKLFNGSLKLIELLKKHNKKFFFLSNNSSRSTTDYLKKLKSMNFDITIDNIIISQHPTIDFLKNNHYSKIFLMGNTSLKEEFKQEGFILTESDPEILVLAFDQEFTYKRLEKAALLLQKNIPYIATHPDDRCPTEDGYIPDAGGIAELLYRAAERRPRIFGKPNKEMLLFKLNQLDIAPEDAIMFGDRLYTDIRMGIDAGVSTCCVLSGETTLKMIKKSPFKPTFVIDGVWELIEIFLTE